MPVFELIHHTRAPIEIADGTASHFVADGIEAALDLPKVGYACVEGVAALDVMHVRLERR